MYWLCLWKMACFARECFAYPVHVYTSQNTWLCFLSPILLLTCVEPWSLVLVGDVHVQAADRQLTEDVFYCHSECRGSLNAIAVVLGGLEPHMLPQVHLFSLLPLHPNLQYPSAFVQYVLMANLSGVGGSVWYSLLNSTFACPVTLLFLFLLLGEWHNCTIFLYIVDRVTGCSNVYTAPCRALFGLYFLTGRTWFWPCSLFYTLVESCEYMIFRLEDLCNAHHRFTCYHRAEGMICVWKVWICKAAVSLSLCICL